MTEIISETIQYGDIKLHIYENLRGKEEINISNSSENITLSIKEARLLATMLLGIKSRLMLKEEE